MMNDIIKEKLKTLPTQSGVYVMLNSDGDIIYVGKARVLKNRVRQYFNNSPKTPKVGAMVSKIHDFRYVITKNEVDALILENNLIKTHKPYYNILLKDDKAYPYIRIDLKEPYPILTLTRTLRGDGAKYFGPFMQGVSVKDVIGVVNAVYPIRTCKKSLPSSRKQRPCLNHHIGLCLAPCVGGISVEDYHKILKDVMEFLKGHTDKVKRLLKQKMDESADRLDFESAIIYRKHLEVLSKLAPDTVTALPRDITGEVFSIKTRGDKCVVGVLRLRSGRMIGADNYEILDFDESGGITSFIADFYKDTIPENIIVANPHDGEILQTYFDTLNIKCKVIVPQKGVYKKLVDMATNNASDHIDKLLGDRAEALKCNEALSQLANALNMPPPMRMECYDISHISGTLKVASMVVFESGAKASGEYRRFRIKSVEGSDDFACLAETLKRRIEKYHEQDESFTKTPDLIVIDGGKGQLSAVKKIVDDLGFSVNLVSLAKKEELIFTTYSDTPIVLDKSSAGLMLVQRLRDEAHRFAITYHRKLRADNMTKSILSEIDGIGKKKIDILYKHFKSVTAIEGASIDELASITGISKRDAENIYLYFH